MIDATNEPRCELLSERDDEGNRQRCRAQGAGEWRPSDTVAVVLCDDDQRYLSVQLNGMRDDEWHPFLSAHELERIADRVERMAAGYFG